jgi:hypothetical protein
LAKVSVEGEELIMTTDVKVLLLIQTRRYRDSVAALLTTMPDIEVILGDTNRNILLYASSGSAPEVLLYEINPANSEQLAQLQNFHATWPRLKTVLLIDSPKSGLTSHLGEVDLVLPVDATVGELFQSISRLVGRRTFATQSSQPGPLVISC